MNKAQSRAWEECEKCGEKRAGEECGKWGVVEGAERLASRGKAKKVKKRLKFERICVICPRFCALCTNAGSCMESYSYLRHDESLAFEKLEQQT